MHNYNKIQTITVIFQFISPTGIIKNTIAEFSNFHIKYRWQIVRHISHTIESILRVSEVSVVLFLLYKKHKINFNYN